MLRRKFLLSTLSLVAGRLQQDSSQGWIPNHTFSDGKTKHLKYFGEGKVSLLWKPWEKVTKNEWIPHKQLYGDCVAQAAGGAMDLLSTIQIAQGKAERWITKSSCAAIYAGGRNNITHRYTKTGMVGWWAAKYLQTYGNLLRKKYDSIDLSVYSKELVKELKLPQWLLDEAKKHPLRDYSALDSWEEVRDAIASGYPVLFCSRLTVEDSKRDKDGFITPTKYRNPKYYWAHAWVIAGVDDNERPGACLLNSHGKRFGSGPKRHNQPDGSVWVDAKYIDFHVKNSEAYALSNYQGFPRPERKYILW